MAKTTINPSIVGYVTSRDPNNRFFNNDRTFVGKDQEGFEYITYIRSIDIDDIINSKCVNCAALRIYITSNNTLQNTVITPYLIDSNWNTSTISWNNQPVINLSAKGSSISVTKSQWVTFDISNIVKLWRSGVENNGIVLIANVSGMNFIKEICNTDVCFPEFKPQICIDTTDPNKTFICGVRTASFNEQYLTSDVVSSSAWIDISQFKKLIYYITNTGLNGVDVKLQYSIDKINIIEDPVYTTINAGQIIYLEPKIYSKYIRVIYKNSNLGLNSSIDIQFQSSI